MKNRKVAWFRSALSAQFSVALPNCGYGRARHSVRAAKCVGVSKALLLFGCVIAACVVAGCQSTSPSQYISPRVEGRVLDAQTHQPIAGVKVHRVVPDQEPAVDEAPKGGAVLERTPAVRSRQDGTFVLDSERDLELFQRSGWDSVTLSFEHAGYETFTTNYTLVNTTQTPGGEPLVKAGDILLAPLSK